MTKICTMLIGAPGTGKSTWLASQQMHSFAYIASTDNIIQCTAEDNGMTYDEAFKDLIAFAEKAMWRNIKMAAEEGDPIYIDRTNMTAKGRQKFVQFLKPYGYVFEAVVFLPPEESEWQRRLNSREGKTIPDHIINSMLKSFTMPTVSEGFNTITIV